MFKMDYEINAAECFRDVKKKKGREREKSTHWICQLVLLVDLKESISGRGGVGEEANYKE